LFAIQNGKKRGFPRWVFSELLSELLNGFFERFDSFINSATHNQWWG
jgi:hypothetical protein